MPSTVVQFLAGYGKDHKGRTLPQVRIMPDWKFEREHDFIQWMFPSDIYSKFYDEAPVLTDEDIEYIKQSEVIQEQIQLSLFRVIAFYEKDDYWITQMNHNFLRLTRILRFLWLAGRKHDYVCLSKILDDIWIDYSDIIGEETFLYWKNANNKDFLLNHKPAPKPTPVSIPIANSQTNPYNQD